MNEPEISPLAKRLAEENNVNWRRLAGSGPNGRVVERDVLEYLARVMAGEEDTDPTPEPVPSGMQAWPDEDVRGFQAGVQGAADAPAEDAFEPAFASGSDDDLLSLDDDFSDFADTDLVDTDLSDSGLSDSGLSDSGFADSAFADRGLVDSDDFSDADFADAMLTDDDLTEPAFAGSDAAAPDRSETTFAGANVSAADFAEATFGDPDFGDPDFSDPDFSDPDFGDADFSDPDFGDTDFGNTSFGNADLAAPDFSSPFAADSAAQGEAEISEEMFLFEDSDEDAEGFDVGLEAEEPVFTPPAGSRSGIPEPGVQDTYFDFSEDQGDVDFGNYGAQSAEDEELFTDADTFTDETFDDGFTGTPGVAPARAAAEGFGGLDLGFGDAPAAQDEDAFSFEEVSAAAEDSFGSEDLEDDLFAAASARPVAADDVFATAADPFAEGDDFEEDPFEDSDTGFGDTGFGGAGLTEGTFGDTVFAAPEDSFDEEAFSEASFDESDDEIFATADEDEDDLFADAAPVVADVFATTERVYDSEEEDDLFATADDAGDESAFDSAAEPFAPAPAVFAGLDDESTDEVFAATEDAAMLSESFEDDFIEDVSDDSSDYGTDTYSSDYSNAIPDTDASEPAYAAPEAVYGEVRVDEPVDTFEADSLAAVAAPAFDEVFEADESEEDLAFAEDEDAEALQREILAAAAQRFSERDDSEDSYAAKVLEEDAMPPRTQDNTLAANTLYGSQSLAGQEAPPPLRIDAPLVSYGLLLRRYVDMGALQEARDGLGMDLQDGNPIAPTALLLRAAAKTMQATSLSAQPNIALAVISDRGLGTRRLADAANAPFTRLYAAVTEAQGSQTTEFERADLIVADMSGLEIDEAVLNVGAPVLTLGRILYSEGRYRATLSLSGELSPRMGSDFLGRVAALLESPIRLLL